LERNRPNIFIIDEAQALLKGPQKIFSKKEVTTLIRYLIAIDDKNVLPFKIDYFKPYERGDKHNLKNYTQNYYR